MSQVFAGFTVGGADSDFSRWWLDTGQFVQPVGDLRNKTSLWIAKNVAAAVWNEVNADTKKRINKIDEELADETRSLTRADCLIDDIEGCLRGGDPADALAEIKTFIEHYRDQTK